MIVVTYILFLLPSLRLFFNLSLHSFPSVIIATVPCGFAAGHPGVLPLFKINAGQQDAALREKENIDSSFNERVVVTFLVRNSPLPTVNLISLDCDGKCRAEAAGACKAL